MARSTDPPLPGADKLARWLKRNRLSITKFAAQHDMDRIQVQRLLNGERQRVSVTMAARIEHATSGEVPWSSWIPRSEAA